MRLIGEHIVCGLLLTEMNISIRDTLHAVRIARDILWVEEANVPLKDFVDISQT